MLQMKIEIGTPSPPNSEICFGSLQKETLDRLGWVPPIRVFAEVMWNFSVIQEHFQVLQSNSGCLSLKVNIWSGDSVSCGRRFEVGFHKSWIISVPNLLCQCGL